MHDFDSVAWADNHHRLSRAIHHLVRTIVVAFAHLNRIQFDAPWQRRGRSVRIAHR